MPARSGDDDARAAAALVAAVALLLGVAGVVVTFSRAGFLTLAAIGVCVGVLVRRRAGGRALVAAAGSRSCVPPVLPQGYSSASARSPTSNPTRPARPRADGTTSIVAMDVAARNPITGVGLGQNVLALNQERGATWREVHNVYLQYAVDLGVPGLLLFLAALRVAVPDGRARAAHGRATAAMRDVGRRRRQRAGGAGRVCRRGLLSPGGLSVLLLPASAGLALAVQNVLPRPRRRAGAAAGMSSAGTDVDDRIRLLKIVPTLLCGGTETSVHDAQRGRWTRAFPAWSWRACGRVGAGVAEAVRARHAAVGYHDIGPFRSARTLAQQARLARDIVAAPDRDRARLQLLRQRLRDAAGAARRGAGGDRVDSRLRAVPDADAAARAAADVPRGHVRRGQRRRGAGLAGRRRVRPPIASS